MRTRRAGVGALVAAQTVSAGLAYRDLAARRPDQVRGGKRLWRVLIALNQGNSLLYWLFGRKR